ncbi:MAG: hypothetical protein BRC24_01835 [Parcubacteria group bacterium SW_4_46_8]|nr:MAG: hypothetical protein BRC24_01835 [Parcubacteria group bacterium SW_4_46_8]
MLCSIFFCNVKPILLPIIFALLIVSILAGIEWSKHAFHLNSEITRKIAHTLTAGISVFTPYYLPSVEIVILSGGFALFLLFTRHRHTLSSIHQVSRRTQGAELLPVGIGLAALTLLPAHVLAFQFGVLVLAGADSLAYLIGTTYGHHPLPLPKISKTWEGVATFVIVTFFTVLLLGKSLTPAVGSGIMLLTLLELLSPRGLDNLFLAPGAGIIWLFIF